MRDVIYGLTQTHFKVVDALEVFWNVKRKGQSVSVTSYLTVSVTSYGEDLGPRHTQYFCTQC